MTAAKPTDTPLPGLDRWLWRGILAVFIGLPFHAFFITWLGGHAPVKVIDALRLWYEGVTVLVALGAAWQVRRDRLLARQLMRERANLLIVAFTLLHLVIWLALGAGLGNGILALKVNLEFLVLYLAARVLALRHPESNLAERSLPFILIPAAIVAAFGMIQLAVGRHDVLRLFGFDPNRPNQFVVDHTLRRLSSTIWGPNQLGSYLVLPSMLALWLAIYRRVKWAYVLLAALLVVLFGSQSRGAWTAVAVGAVVIVWLRLNRPVHRLALLGVLAAGVAGILVLNHYRPVLVEHNAISNTGHFQAVTKGFDRLSTHPLGAGLEAAGKASESTDEKLYTENFYLQIAVQVGWEGLVLFVTTVALVGWYLWRPGPSGIALPLLAALVGLSVNNLVAHTWSDAATAMLWWGLAGLAIKKELAAA